MDDPAKRFAAKLRVISAQVKEWEDRDLQESGSTTRPLFFADLEELATILEGKSGQYRATISPIQNWPQSLDKLRRDFEIAELVHSYRVDPERTVSDGIEAAVAKFRCEGIDIESVRRANRLYGRFFREGTSDAAFMVRALAGAKLARG